MSMNWPLAKLILLTLLSLFKAMRYMAPAAREQRGISIASHMVWASTLGRRLSRSYSLWTAAEMVLVRALGWMTTSESMKRSQEPRACWTAVWRALFLPVQPGGG